MATETMAGYPGYGDGNGYGQCGASYGDYGQESTKYPHSYPSTSSGPKGDTRTGPVDHDYPPFSRVFIVCSKNHTSDDLRAAFEEYGNVEDVWVVKDKHTKESRGVAYIKFSKMSEACLAVENMDGKTVGSDPRAIKAIIAQPKSTKSTEDFDDETALTRLFVSIPKSTDEDQLREAFEKYGELDYVQVMKDRKTRESKGFGYVKFFKPYDAAVALENCDKAYRAVMAEPKSAKIKRERDHQPSDSYFPFGVSSSEVGPSGGPGMGSSEVYAPPAFAASVGFADARSMGNVCNRLQVQVMPTVAQDNLARLFDLIPGMEMCDLKRNFSTGESRGVAFVVYNSVGSAIYAKEKLNGFEYPPGFKLTVKYAPDDESSTSASGGGGMVPTPYTTAALPAPQPLADSKAECAERLFIVCNPNPPPDHALKDVFSRFGSLIDVYMLKNRNCGYAKYAKPDNAQNAMDALHGQEIMGMKVKVLPADPPKTNDPARKRPRTQRE